MSTNDCDPTTHIIHQGRALVRAIEGIGAIQADWPLERLVASLLLAVYKRRLRGIVAAAPTWEIAMPAPMAPRPKATEAAIRAYFITPALTSPIFGSADCSSWLVPARALAQNTVPTIAIIVKSRTILWVIWDLSFLHDVSIVFFLSDLFIATTQ